MELAELMSLVVATRLSRVMVAALLELAREVGRVNIWMEVVILIYVLVEMVVLGGVLAMVAKVAILVMVLTLAVAVGARQGKPLN